MSNMKQTVQDTYGKIAQEGGTCCESSSCCATTPTDADETSRRLGYAAEQTAAVPAGANLGLGCGNPQAIAALQPGETVLDLGSGGGFDCFLAAQQVGPNGHVIGVDMTVEMIALARNNATKAVKAGSPANVEFLLGEIESLPLADRTVDVILSNCVINLSPDKPAVFREAFRVLKPGGRLAISDVVTTAPLTASVRDDMQAVTACVGGAATIDEVSQMLTDAGFEQVNITPLQDTTEVIRDWSQSAAVDNLVVSAKIEGRRP